MGGGHVLDDIEQVVGVSSQLSVVGLVSVLGLISVCNIDQAGGGGRSAICGSCLIAELRGCTIAELRGCTLISSLYSRTHGLWTLTF